MNKVCDLGFEFARRGLSGAYELQGAGLVSAWLPSLSPRQLPLPLCLELVQALGHVGGTYKYLEIPTLQMPKG